MRTQEWPKEKIERVRTRARKETFVSRPGDHRDMPLKVLAPDFDSKIEHCCQSRITHSKYLLPEWDFL